MLKCKGSGGLQELRDTLDEDSINFCLFRFMSGDQESKRVKFMCAAGGTAHPHTPCEGCRRLSLLEVRTSTGAPTLRRGLRGVGFEASVADVGDRARALARAAS